MEQKAEMELYQKKGNVGGAVGAIIYLVVGIGVATLVIIFVGTLGGQTYSLTESQINNISNATIRDAVKDSVISGFTSLKTTTQYMPIIILAVIIGIVLTLVLGFTNFSGNGGGSAL